MSSSAVQFGVFTLDPFNRRLSRGGEVVEINPRYLDVLILLVRGRGELVTKDRFMNEVWSGVPVTDEALTQAIRTLRRTLGDTVAAPRYIETVPKHGYRFIAEVEPVPDCPAENAVGRSAAPVPASPNTQLPLTRIAMAGAGGAILGGAVVGLLYGFIGAAQPNASSGGALSLLLVLVLISMLSSGVAGAGIASGIAAATVIRPKGWYWTAIGGAFGGTAIGAFAHLLGKDAFRLLLGQEVTRFAGAFEGLILGGVVGLAACLSRGSAGRATGTAALLGAGAGLIIALLDGRMMAGSLQELVGAFPASRFRFEAMGGAFGEGGLGPIGRAVTASFEGAVFSAGMVWAITVWRRGDAGVADQQRRS